LDSERGWLAVSHVPLVRQHGEHDCGAAALAMVIERYRPDLKRDAFFRAPANQRVSAEQLRDHARALGFEAFVVQGTADDLVHELRAGRPVVVGVAKPTVQGPVAHYQVLVGMHAASQRVALLDPAEGWRQNSFAGFLREWQASGNVLLVVIPREAQVAPAPAPAPAPVPEPNPPPSAADSEGGTSSAWASGTTRTPQRSDHSRVNAAPR
jgi:ABC-type bacteriocin/lantibiotic exporter with double-glycine peptidase domain